MPSKLKRYTIRAVSNYQSIPVYLCAIAPDLQFGMDTKKALCLFAKPKTIAKIVLLAEQQFPDLSCIAASEITDQFYPKFVHESSINAVLSMKFIMSGLIDREKSGMR